MEKNTRVIGILTAIFGTAAEMAKQTGMRRTAAEKLMQTGEIRLKEYHAIHKVTGLTADAILGI